MNEPTFVPGAEPDIPALLVELRALIRQARQRALRAVDTIQVQTCWELGRHIVEFEQGGAAREGLRPASVAQTGEGTDLGVWQGF